MATVSNIHPDALSIIITALFVMCAITLIIRSIDRDIKSHSRADTLDDYKLSEYLHSMR